MINIDNNCMFIERIRKIKLTKITMNKKILWFVTAFKACRLVKLMFVHLHYSRVHQKTR